MILNGVYISEVQFSVLCAKQKITNPEWVSWIMDVFNKNSSKYIKDAIKIGTKQMNNANKEIRRLNN